MAARRASSAAWNWRRIRSGGSAYGNLVKRNTRPDGSRRFDACGRGSQGYPTASATEFIRPASSLRSARLRLAARAANRRPRETFASSARCEKTSWRHSRSSRTRGARAPRSAKTATPGTGQRAGGASPIELTADPRTNRRFACVGWAAIAPAVSHSASLNHVVVGTGLEPNVFLSGLSHSGGLRHARFKRDDGLVTRRPALSRPRASRFQSSSDRVR